LPPTKKICQQLQCQNQTKPVFHVCDKQLTAVPRQDITTMTAVKNVMARATIFSHVAVKGLSCTSRLLQRKDNFVGRIIAFSCVLGLIFSRNQRHSYL
jgi:hypothetical protein